MTLRPARHLPHQPPRVWILPGALIIVAHLLSGTPARASAAAAHVQRLAEQTAPAYPSDLTPFGGILFFAADDGHGGRALWRTDGTAAGTTLVKAGEPGAVVENLTDVNGVLFFTEDLQIRFPNPSAREPAPIDAEPGLGTQTVTLWKSDGTGAGTVRLREFDSMLTWYTAGVLTAGGTTLFLVVDDGVHGHELWASDGTADGTVLIKDIHPGPGDGVISPYNFVSINGVLFFDGDDGRGGTGLWKSDGTEKGTVLVKSPPPAGFAYDLIALNGGLYFAVNDYDMRQFQLWRSDGTTDGTSLVQSISSGVNVTGVGQLTNVEGTVFFVVPDNGGPGGALWRSDGTTAGTAVARHFGNTPASGLPPGEIVAAGGTLFFVANCHFLTGSYLWKSDGTADGTVLVSCDGSNGVSYISNLTAFDHGTVFYSVTDNAGGALWRSDGTGNGTIPVHRFVAPGPANLQPVNHTLFFVADDGQSGQELWKTDGTEAGTMLVKDINTPVPALCVGDCNGNGVITVDEIITMMNEVLGNVPLSACLDGNASNGGRITVGDILSAVNNALSGCHGAPIR